MCECSGSVCVCVCVCVCLHLSLQLSRELALAMFNCALSSSKNVQGDNRSLESHCFQCLCPTCCSWRTEGWRVAGPCSAGTSAVGCMLSSSFCAHGVSGILRPGQQISYSTNYQYCVKRCRVTASSPTLQPPTGFFSGQISLGIAQFSA